MRINQTVYSLNSKGGNMLPKKDSREYAFIAGAIEGILFVMLIVLLNNLLQNVESYLDALALADTVDEHVREMYDISTANTQRKEAETDESRNRSQGCREDARREDTK